ncbi:MAG TPA: zinc-binding dehydrogenase [Actinoplanes sp.]|nr:zinc-binding dehydrogenase [Actinoplanes sp.]
MLADPGQGRHHAVVDAGLPGVDPGDGAGPLLGIVYLTEVLGLLSAGVLTPQVAARIPLSQAATALTLAESRTVAGKVVLLPDAV